MPKKKEKTLPKIKPVNEYCLLRPDDRAETSAGGIVLPMATQERQTTGTLEAVSEDSAFSAGDRVIYQKYGAVQLELNAQKVFMIKEKEIVGVLEDE